MFAVRGLSTKTVEYDIGECGRPHFVINAGERDAKSLGLLSRQGRDVRLYEGFR